MGLKLHPFLTHVRQCPKTEHLKTPTIREDGGWPAHEGMQSTKAAYEVLARAEKEMIGVAQDDTSPTSHQIAGAQRLDSGLGANRHKHRGIEGPMRSVQLSQACLAVHIGVKEFKAQGHTWISASAHRQIIGHQKPFSARFSKRVNSPRKLRRTTPVGPFRCLAMLISAMPFSVLSSGL